jgi:hypothetical protein
VQIAEAVYQVLYEGEEVAEMAQGLMTRPIAEDELGLPERAEAVDELMCKLGLSDGAHP